MDNFDLKEKEKFSKLAQEWWDLKGMCRPLHDINPARLQFITDRINIEGKKILDIGCGAGILSESLAKKGAIVTGIDISEDLIQVATEHATSQGLNQTQIRYETALAEDYALAHPQAFDIITCMELLEHVPNPNSLIAACRKLLKPQGKLFCSTLNRTFKAYCLAIIGAEKILKILPKNTHQYEKFIRPQELAQLFRANELELIEFSGMQYNPFTHRTTLNQDVSVNYLAFATVE